MGEEKQDSNLELILRSAKLKRPREADMSNFLSGVHRKIKQGVPSIGFPQTVTVFVLGLICVGLVYLFLGRPERVPVPRPTGAEALSIEEHMEVLEAFDVDVADEITRYIGDDELVDEIAFLDSMELGIMSSPTST
ncbi:MAG: hypothetical protein A3G87_04775 [Omnitrophica bacterium RIFCSPLOWO2_12_FULL_50_11]|nr:MAG: hypothetical protein A3G87_04775 [Omnitrophica bacterium RIFCSPLOWO2_12_FULL_50_11]